MPVHTRCKTSGGCRKSKSGWVGIVWLWAFSKQVMVQIRWGRPDWSGYRSSLRPAGWAWSGAVATRGVNQEDDHADRGSDKIAASRGLRPECSRRPVSAKRADVAVAQPVVDQREQFACRGDLGDVFAAASFDAVFVGRDLGRGLVTLHRFDRCPADQLRALFGDMPAMYDGVGLAVAWGQSGPAAQLGGPGESVHVTDLGDEYRRQRRSDAG